MTELVTIGIICWVAVRIVLLLSRIWSRVDAESYAGIGRRAT
jgi:hypothetical protein